MKRTTLKIAAATAVATFALFAAPSSAQVAVTEGGANKFAEVCDTDKDGMVSRDELMKRMEMAWNKADTKKAGRLDKAQMMVFLREFYVN